MQTRLEIKRIELFSLFKIAFFIYAIIGLVVGLIYGFVVLVADGFQSAFLGDEFPQLGMLTGVIGLLAIPFVAMIYGMVGSVFVTIGGVVFNLISAAVGGLRFETVVEVAHEQPSVPRAPQPPPPPIAGSITPPDGPTLTRSPSLDD